MKNEGAKRGMARWSRDMNCAAPQRGTARHDTVRRNAAQRGMAKHGPPRCGAAPQRDLFREEDGFSTVGMVVALLVTLSLVFSAARVYRVHSASADIQNVADAAALAAENEVAEFMVAVRVCDAVVLSLSLTGLTAYGLGVVALCVPPAAGVGEKLIELGSKVMDARDAFADKAATGLNALQKALPFLAAANAASVAAANNDASPLSANYLALAILVPSEGEEIGIDAAEAAGDAKTQVQENADDLQQAAQEAEEAAQEANEAKERAFLRDCGDNPAYCMYERAQTLSPISDTDNPLYHSVDAWSFSVPLKRAQAYYAARLAAEEPQGSSVEEQARSALRERFYRYAASELEKGYVHDEGDTFDAYFPLFPKNTAEMRETSLYTEAVYPVTSGSGAPVMHAWEGCPEAAGATGRGSVSDMESLGYETCPTCQFSAASLGKVAAASTSIDNGFEYHYAAVAQAARDYQEARENMDPQVQAVKEKANSLFDACKEALLQVGGQRIQASPPGRCGVVVMVANLSEAASSTGFESSFVQEGGVLGVRAAVSAATLIPDTAEEGESVLSSLLDGFAEDGGAAVGAARVVLDCWSAFLGAYASGQEALEDGTRRALDGLSLGSASGLGTWAADAWSTCLQGVGLEPAQLDALKPVLVNSGQVASADDGTFAVRFLAAKERALAASDAADDASEVFSSIIGSVGGMALGDLVSDDGMVEIAVIEFPVGDVSLPITITLPPAAREAADGFADSLAEALRTVQEQVSGVRTWE